MKKHWGGSWKLQWHYEFLYFVYNMKQLWNKAESVCCVQCAFVVWATLKVLVQAIWKMITADMQAANHEACLSGVNDFTKDEGK